MQKIFLIMGPGTQPLCIKGHAGSLGRILISLVGKAFGGKVSFTAAMALKVIDAADLQVEIRYAADFNEKTQGKPFSPTLGQQRDLIDMIEAKLHAFLRSKGLNGYTISVLCEQYSGGILKMFDVGKKAK